MIQWAAVKKVLHPINVPEHHAEADLRLDPLSTAPAAGYLIVPSPFTIRLDAFGRRLLLSLLAVAFSAWSAFSAAPACAAVAGSAFVRRSSSVWVAMVSRSSGDFSGSADAEFTIRLLAK
jgi:hypothetical protein